MALNKREYTDTETVITAENLNDIQDAVIALEEGLFTVDDDKSGETITITDASSRGFRSFNIYGKTTQDGTPTPDAPVELVSVGGGGSITVTVTGDSKAQSLTIATPNGLPGIPVSSGGNYTDTNGQQWICDEIDFARGVYISRVKKAVLQANDYAWYIGAASQQTENTTLFYCYVNDKKQGAVNFMCDRFQVRNVIGSTYDFNGICGSANNLIYVRLDGVYTLEEFKFWLEANPITIVYEIAIAVESPLSGEEQAAYAALHTYKEFTTVSNDSLAYMELEYVMDAKKYIDSRVISSGGAAENTLFVTTDNVHASRNSDEIMTALQNGRHVILELASGVYATNVSTDQEYAYFDQLVDNTITRYTIDRHGNVSFANLFGDIETALDAIITMQEELIGS